MPFGEDSVDEMTGYLRTTGNTARPGNLELGAFGQVSAGTGGTRCRELNYLFPVNLFRRNFFPGHNFNSFYDNAHITVGIIH